MGQKQRKRKARLESSRGERVADRKTITAPPLAESPPVTRTFLWISAGIAALVAIVYWQVRHFQFVYLDDPVYVADNSNVLQGLSWAGVRWALTTQAAGNWHPLTWVSHMGDVDLYGVNAGGHHVTSVIIHILNSVLLFAAMYRMTSGIGRSAFVAALFAIHPLHVESVAWVSERKDVLSALFWILAIHAYVSYVRHRGVMRYLLVVLFSALGLMSKPMVVTLPFTLLLLDYWPLKRIASDKVTKLSSWYPLILEKIPLFVLTIFSMVVTVKVQRGYGAVVALNQLPLATRVGNALVAYCAYMRDLLWPAKLAAFYPFRMEPAGVVFGAAAILIAFTFLALKYARRHPYLLVGWAWYVGTLIPAIGIVQVGDQARADRYTYVPAIGLLIIVAWGVWELTQRWRFQNVALWTIGSLVTTACAIVSFRQVSYWQNNLNLFTRAVAVTEKNYRAHALLGVALSASGKNAEALEHYRASIAIWPGNAEARSNLGAALVAVGKPDEALQQFSEAVRYKPETALYHYNYGVMLSEKGRTGEAISEIRRSVELDPGNKAFVKALDLLVAKRDRE